MTRQNRSAARSVVVVLDGDTDAGHQVARQLLAEGHCVAVVARHAAGAVRVLHGQHWNRVMVIAADTSDERQWQQVVARVADRFGRIDTIVRAGDAALRASA